MVPPKDGFTCVIRIKMEGKKNHEKKKKNINLVLLHVNHTFLILEPKPLDTFIVP
jgi:hypothetical protein